MKVNLEDVCERGTSALRQSDVENENGIYPVFGAAGLIGNADFYHQEKPYVAVVKDGAGIGRTMRLPGKSSVIGTMQYLLPKSNVLPEYLCYVVRYMHLEKYYSGATIPHIYFRDYKDEAFNLDQLEKQAEIVNILCKVEKIIAARKQQINEMDNLIKTRFVEMFGDTFLNPYGWEKNFLGMVCDVRDGTHDSPQYYEMGYPLVTSKNVTAGRIDLSDCSLINETDYNKINERSKVDIGDIIMPMIGTVGKPVIVDIEPNFAIKNVALVKFRQASKVLNIYIRALLQSNYFDDAVLNKVRGGTQKFISLGDIRQLEVLVPPIELQNQFAAFVTQVDKSKVAVQAALNGAQTLFDSLMQQYFG